MPTDDEEPGPAIAERGVAEIVEVWFAEHFHGSAAMRDTEAFNHVRRSVDELKRRLEEHPQ